jgi:hypothetical protein
MIIAFRKRWGVTLSAPDSISSSLRVHMFVALSEIAINRSLSIIRRFIVTVVNDRARHATKN